MAGISLPSYIHLCRHVPSVDRVTLGLGKPANNMCLIIHIYKKQSKKAIKHNYSGPLTGQIYI